MKTDEWKQVVIKSPKLRNFRKGLRTVLKLAVGRKIDESLDLEVVNRVLSKEVQRILGFYDRSILRCSNGSLCKSANSKRPDIVSLGLDMVWDPIFRNWHCLKCHDYYLGTEESKRLYKKNHDDEVALWDKLVKDLES